VTLAVYSAGIKLAETVCNMQRGLQNFGNIVPARIRRLRLITEIRRAVGETDGPTRKSGIP
jgi:hypothetical protein